MINFIKNLLTSPKLCHLQPISAIYRFSGKDSCMMVFCFLIQYVIVPRENIFNIIKKSKTCGTSLRSEGRNDDTIYSEIIKATKTKITISA